MREFILYSRKGRTDANFKSMREGGYLDTVHQCILTSLFKSHGHRHDVIFHVILGGSPNPPRHIEISGAELKDANVDERSWERILKKVLAPGGQHPGVKKDRDSLQALVRKKAEEGAEIYILEERDLPISEIKFGEHCVFVLGDHIGIPKKDEKYVLRYGRKLSLGKQKYLAASCIDIINYTFDVREL